MSVRKSWTLWCDACDDVLDDGTLGTETAQEAREFAKRDDGTHVNLPGGRDICSACWDEGKR